jgi:hypothetical protein
MWHNIGLKSISCGGENHTQKKTNFYSLYIVLSGAW